MTATPATADPKALPQLLGHPTGLYTLFFAEMWERFSYYGMRALLVFYMIKGFLGYGDKEAYAVYGAYTALVYMTPFFGGLIADQLLGARRAVVLGGLLMAAGHLAMTVENEIFFFFALALLIVGNGFFKPNISTIVGTLYPQGSPKRDGGFIIFYMGVNLGAAMSPLLCGYIGETYGWHYGFGLATIGMLIGIAVFVAPTRLTQTLIGMGALGAAFALLVYRSEGNAISLLVNVFVAVALVVAGVIALMALERGGLPHWAGSPRNRKRLTSSFLGPLSREYSVYLGAILVVPVFALLVSGFSPLRADGTPLTLISENVIANMQASSSAITQVLAVVVEEVSKPAGLVLALAGLISLVYLGIETFRLSKIPRERMFAALVMIFFSMLFWSFFEQAGSSLNNFADRNIDRVAEGRVLTESDVGTTMSIQPTQEQLGYRNGGEMFTITTLDDLRETAGDNPEFMIDWTVSPGNVGMTIADRNAETPASVYQAFNPIYILIFGLVFTGLWGFLANRKLEPSTPFKFGLGLLQLGLGFGAFWYGAQNADERGMVALSWLLLGYLLHTTGELCLSPVGLSMVTRMAPARLVSTVMGTWFLATAFAQYLAAIISQFTGVSHGDGGGSSIPIPKETVNIYGGVFGQIAVVAIGSSLVMFVLVPILKRWMHEDVLTEES
ncbi:MAG: MFS transporter [bacterium]|nr:MFS transporter [bacterium]